MAPNSRIYLTRHAQAEHNVDLDYSILDAPLTSLGKKQAATLAHRIPSQIMSNVDLIVTSPLTRTLQTTLLAYAPAVSRLGKPSIICLPAVQECNGYPCDTGRSAAELSSNPDFSGLDFSRLMPDWTSKQGFYAPDSQSLAERARYVRQFLKERPEKEIVLVGHGDVLRQITTTKDGPGTYMWRNAEMRVYVFDEENEGEDCFLRLEEVVDATGGYGPTSTAMDLEDGNDTIVNGKI